MPRVNYKKINRMMRILMLFNESRNTYGASRIKLVLCEEGDNITTKTVSDYMKELNLIPKSYEKRLENQRKLKPSYEGINNKIRYIKPTHINQIWTGDITEIKTNEGKCYLSTIMDKYSRKIISYGISDKMDSKLVTDVLQKAYDIRKPNKGILIHTNKGSQYRSKQYVDFVESIGGVLSYTRPDYNCADNAIQESFHASLKKEDLYVTELDTIEEAKIRVADYINNFYNKKRFHSDISNDINDSLINRIDLIEGSTDSEKEKMYKILIEMGYTHNEMYPDLNEKIRAYRQQHNL